MDYLDTHGGRIVVPRNQIIYSHIIIDCCGIYCEQRIARIVDPIRTQLLVSNLLFKIIVHASWGLWR